MKAIRLILLAGVTLLALGSCQKDEKLGGQEVRFSAANPSTKTAYDPGAPGQINWMDGELVGIWSDKATLRYDAGTNYYAYVVKNSAGNLAELDNQDNDNGLIYNGNGAYQFWGVSPAGAAALTIGESAVTAEYSISATQGPGEGDVTGGIYPADMNQAVLLAKTSISEVPAPKTKPIYLRFRPSFTAFEVEIVRPASTDVGAKDIVIKSVEVVSGEGLAGTVTATFNTDTTNDVDDDGSITYTVADDDRAQITYQFPDENPATLAAAGGTVTFTVFAVPLDGEGLQFKFHLSDGQVRTATLYKKGSGGTLEPFSIVDRQKHRLYGLIMPDDFKMFTNKAELDEYLSVEDPSESTEKINL